jgi:hypothetical protein
MVRTTIRTILLVGVTAAATVVVAATPAQAASPCKVRDGAATYGTLPAAVDAADPGATLVITGTCGAGETIIAKDLTLAGGAFGANRPVLTGRNAFRVLRIEPEATVTLTDLIIRDGNSAAFSGGGGILNAGDLTVIRVHVTHNRGTTGAGGGILNFGNLELTRSTVSDNRSPFEGGGIFNAAGDIVTWRATITGNVAAGVGGGIFNEGSVRMHASLVSQNTAQAGGGITNVSILDLDRTSVVNNVPDNCDC